MTRRPWLPHPGRHLTQARTHLHHYLTDHPTRTRTYTYNLLHPTLTLHVLWHWARHGRTHR